MILFLIHLKLLYESFLPLSTLFLVFFNNWIRSQLFFLPLHTVVATVVSENGPSEFVWFVASLKYYEYGIKWFVLTSSILSIVLSKTNLQVLSL